MSEQKPWEMNWSQPAQTQPNNANKKPWEMDWGQPEPQKEQDGALTRGWTKAKNSMAISADLATGNTASAAQKVKEADDYSKANPGSKEGKVLMDAWDRGDGITGGISEVVGQIKKNAEKSDGVIGGVRSVGKDLQAMGSGLLEQTPNMIAPMTGMAAGAKAGSMAGGAIGAAFGGVGAAPGAAIGGVVGSVAGGAAGNTAIEGGYHLLDSVQKAGINPQDTKAVQAFIEKNGDKVFDEAATKGLILGAVDAATWRMGRFFLDAPAKAATSRALTEMGVDAADKAAVKTAMQSNDFAQRIAADTAYQTSLKGAENVARNTAAFATEPAGEFAGEYFGSGIGYGDWDTKNAALEAMSSLGQSGVMYGGQKAFQYLTKPKSAVNAEQQAANTQGEQAKETQAIRDVQSQLFGGDVPNPFLDPSKLNPFSDNAPPASPIIDMARLEPADGNPRYDNGINFQAPNIETPLSLVEQQQTQADNGIDFERPEQGPTDLERQIQFNNTFGLETPNPVVDYNSISPFDSNPQQPVIDLAKVDPTLSQRLGINPNDGPLSSAAALAVDTGISSEMQQSAAVVAAQDENNNAPLSTAAGLFNAPTENTNAGQPGLDQSAQDNKSGIIDGITGKPGEDLSGSQTNDSTLQNATNANRNAERVDDNRSNTQQITQQQLANVDTQIAGIEQQLSTEKSMPKKLQMRKQLKDLNAERATITKNNESAMKPESLLREGARNDSVTTSSFQTQPLDHGALNVPLSKRGNIDAQLDQYKKEQTALENGKREIQKGNHADAQAIAKPMFDTLSTEQIKTYANKAGIKPSEAKKELKSMAHWQPQKAVKVFEALKAVGTKLDKPVTPPTLPNLGGVEQIQALEQQLAVEKSVPKKARIRKQIAELQKHSPIDQAAHQAATSVQNDLPEPTQAQIEAGNYKKGHIKVHGLDIAIENPRGSERRGKDPDGNEWAHTMSDHYGYFKRTIGSDKENIDTYVGRNPESEQVFIVDQLDQQTDGFDEHKVMLGFNSQDEAVKAYSSNFDKGWKVGPVHTMTKDEFKTWLKEGDTTKPAGESIQQSKIFAQIQSDSRLTHSIPIKLMDQVHELGSIVNDLTSIKTEGVKTNVLYGKQLLAKIAKLNPDVQIHIISDLNNIQDKTIRAGLVDGGYYVPAQNTSYIYPKSKAWQSSALELVNHELVHSVSEQIIFDSLLPQEYDQKLNKMIAKIGDYLFENSELLSENVTNRLSYAFNTNPQHEVLAVGIAELEVRESLKNILGNTGLLELDGIFTAITEQYGNSNEQRKQRSDTGNGEKILHGTVPGTDTGTADRLQDVPAGTESGKKHKRSIRTDQTDLSAGEKQQGITDKKRFSRAENRIASSTVEQIRDALVSRFGEKTIADLEAQGILNIVQDQQESMTGNVEGWYENGKVTLVASNLDADSAVATFLHELGGHGGFQNLMNKDAYADLMRQFERMVAQGNPVALEAKRLAERELNREVQLDEYLPYMITLASQMQTKNILQKGAIKRFMDQMISAVKAWLYDKGIKLNLNEKDILALAERMVAAQSSVASNNEDSSSVQNDDIRFSRSSNYSDITNRIMNGFKSLPKVADNKGKDWLKIGLQALTRRQLTEIYSKILPPLNKYNDLAAQMDADKNDAGAEADNIVREWSKLKDENQLAGLMHDATLAKIDPAKPHVAGDSIIKYQQLRNDFNTLSPEAQAMYIKARDAYKKHYANIHQAIKERILRSELSSQKKADLLKKMDDNFFNGYIKGVYFPLARFGEYVIVVRNKNNQVESVSRAETMGEAESVRSELMKKYPLFIVDPIKLDKEFNASRDSVGRGFMSSLFDEVDNLGLAAKEQAEFEDTLSQLYLSSMPDISWAKHGIHRKGTAGFSQDARRAFAQNMFSGANYLAKLRYGDQLVEQLDKMQKHADEQFKNDVHYDQRSAQRVIGEMNKRHDNLMNPQGNPLSSFLTSVGFMYYMGLSPAAAMVNLSQTALIAYPLMGAKWNYDKAGKELLKASRDFAKGVEFNVPDFSSLENFKNSIGDVYSPNIDKVINGLELDAYNQAVSRGVIDVTQAHDLAGIAQGEDSKVMWYFRPAMRLASGLFHHAERFNREVTFIAAYRLATKAGASHTEAFDQAMDMVYRGHFDYSAGNRARFMQSNIAKVVLLFKQYAQNMLYTLLRNAHQSIYALDPKDQREARRALAGILGMHALAAGAIGLPITGMLATASILIAKKSKLGAAAFGIAAMAALASGGGDDDPYELENVIRNWLSDIHPMFADLVFGGVPRAFSPVDLSGRVGLNNLIIPDVQDGLEGADWAKAMQSALLGPVVGISTNLVKGFQEINDGDYGRGIETMLPVVLKNAMKSVRFGREGVLTKNNDVIQDEVGGVGLFSQAIGFSPSDVRTSMEGRSAIYQYKTRLENHRKELMHKWVIAKRDDDSEGMEKAWAEIQEFNEKVSEKNPRMRINRINLMQSYKTNERRAKETGDGGVYLTKRQKGAEEQGRFAFGE